MVAVEQERVRGQILPAPRSRFAVVAPDLALVAACVSLFYCLFLFEGYRQFFRDSDAGWHIRNGEAIVATGTFPHSDPYSFSRPGQPWFAWEWLSDVAAATAHRAAGLSGVTLLYGVAIAAGVWLWFRLHWMLGGNFFFAAAMAPLLLTTCSLHWMARPHVFGWLFLLGTVWIAERGRTNLALIALFSALWANMHASFFFAPVIFLIYALGIAGQDVILRGGCQPPSVANAADGCRLPIGRGLPSRPRWYLAAALVSALAPLANPYGWHLYAHVFRYLTDSDLLSRIGEYQSFDFHSGGSAQIAAALLIGFAGGVLALGRRIEHFLLAALFSFLALRSARVLPLIALVLLPLANSAITHALEEARGLTPRVRRALDSFLSYSARLRQLDARGNGLLLAPLAIAACFALLATPGIRAATGFPPDQFPAAAYSHIPPGGRLFAPDKFGGYLIYRSAGTRKVFFDGRSDFYGAAFLKQYGRLVQVRPGWQQYWNSFGFTHALLPADAPLRAALEQAGWRVVYSDPTSVLLTPSGT
ncbi:MAG TPA: hypothetical protein VKB88_42625 [Bryobacteraceae bacterium]|nr:hypothetical protein [Bryobacteraceae bacterium]